MPRGKRPDESVNLLPLLTQQVQRLEARIKLLEDEARGGIDITKFYSKATSPLPNVPTTCTMPIGSKLRPCFCTALRAPASTTSRPRGRAV